MGARGLVALALATAVTLSGCLSPEAVEFAQWSGGADAELGPADAPGWREGRWWAYRATFPKSNVTLHVALVVDDAASGGYALGTNHSSGFFGLPFAGNVSEELSPEVAGQSWRMFDFPLRDGKQWKQELFGHTVTTTASTATLTLPTGEEAPGFVLEATSYGARFARYTYSPAVGWMTALEIRDPGTGQELLDADLTQWGAEFDEDYYVTVPVHAYEARYPGAVPGEETFQVPRGFQRLTAIVAVSATAGGFDARLTDPHGREAASAAVRVTGFQSEQRELDARSGTWTFEHLGAGKGLARVEVYGVKRADASGAAAGGDGAVGAAVAGAAAMIADALHAG